MKTRPIKVSIPLDNEDKEILKKYYRKTGACGIREGFRRALWNEVVRAKDALAGRNTG